jgi:hypothetical protein
MVPATLAVEQIIIEQGSRSCHDLRACYQTVAGTRAAAADTVISCRKAVKSEIDLVATVATGRASRPVASFFETITTLSM